MKLRPLALALLLVCNWSYAGLFDDQEARKGVAQAQKDIEQLKSSDAAVDARIAKLEEALKNQGLLDLLSQIEALKMELNKLRGQIEVLVNENEMAQKRQKDFYVDLDTRLRRLEQPGPTSPGPASEAKPASSTAAAAPTPVSAGAAKPPVIQPAQPAAPVDAAAEARAYEAAYNLFKIGNYQGAVVAFQNFVKAYPGSSLAPSAQYWIGNSYYAVRDFRAAIASQQKLLSNYPDSQKVPDALLNIASCQQELNDAAGAKKTLEDIVSKYPVSDAAEKAKRRLASLK